MTRLRQVVRRAYRREDGQALLMIAAAMVLVLGLAAFVIDAGHAYVDYQHLQNTADASSLAATQQISGNNPGCSSPADRATLYVASNNGPALPNTGLPLCSPSTSYISSDPSATPNCYQWPYYDKTNTSHEDKVVVWLRSCTATFFGSVVGVPQICESVSSVTQTTPLTQTTSTPASTTSSVSISASVSTGSSTPASTLYSTSVSTTLLASNGSLFALSSACNAIHVESNNATFNGFCRLERRDPD